MIGNKFQDEDDAEAHWWKTWWSNDFSWDGLAQKQIGAISTYDSSGDNVSWEIKGGSFGDLNLQDYWRRDPSTNEIRSDDQLKALGELIPDPNGKLWHLVHVPLQWKDGADAKSIWTEEKHRKLDEIVVARMNAGKATAFQDQAYFSADTLVGADGRAQLLGTVIFELSYSDGNENSDLHINCEGAYIQICDMATANLGPGANFSRALINDADFQNTNFLGQAIFENTIIIRNSNFFKANFLGKADFSRATFMCWAAFDYTTFSTHSMFTGMSCYSQAGFEKAVFFGTAHFRFAKFYDGAYLTLVRFLGPADFGFATFYEDARFGQSAFLGDVEFEHAVFEKAAFFWQVKFTEKNKEGALSFRATVFSGIAEFYKAGFPDRAENFSAAFSGTKFLDAVDYSGAGVHWIAALDNAIIGRRLILDQNTENESNRKFEQMLSNSGDKAPRADLKSKIEYEVAIRENMVIGQKIKSNRINGTERAQWLRDYTNQRLLQLEGGCRVVKQAMGLARDETMEQRYYRYQLIARSNRSDIPFWDGFFSKLYRSVSDYGSSVLKPFINLLLLIVAFAALFWAIGISLNVSDLGNGYSFSSALNVSWSNVFKPLSALADDGQQPDTLAGALFDNENDWISFWTRALATAESILAIILAFLVGLAVRRKFQIN